MASNETVAEITGRMRRIKLCIPRGKVKVDDFDCVVEVSLSDFADRIEAAHKREIAELRECLKEAIREMCPFTRMSCKHGEQCDYVCGTEKWRKALEGGHQ